MNKTYSVATLGGPDRNVERLGTFVAWLVCNHLLAPDIEDSASTPIVRVRTNDLSGPQFLTTVLHGELCTHHLSDAGQAFVEHYFMSGLFDEDYESRDADARLHEDENDWLLYKAVSPKVTAAYRRFNPATKTAPGETRLTAKILRFPFGRRS